MVNKKTIRFSAMQHTTVSQLTGARKRTCKKTWVLLLLFEGSRLKKEEEEEKGEKVDKDKKTDNEEKVEEEGCPSRMYL